MFYRYYHNAWRPITAIRRNETWLASGRDVYDPDWLPLLTPTPPHPEYVSGHSALAGAAAEVLRHHLGDEIALNITSTTNRDNRGTISMHFTSLKKMVEDTSNGRVWGGVSHPRFSFRFKGQPVGYRVSLSDLCMAMKQKFHVIRSSNL